MFSMLKNRLYRFNRWFDKNELFKFFFVTAVIGTAMANIQLGNLFLGVSMVLVLCAFAVYRMFIMDNRVDFDRSKYDVPSIGETVIVKKDFYYDGQFKKYINTSDPSRKPNTWRITKGTEMIIVEVKETSGDWRIRFIDNSPSKGDMSLYYLDTKDYWDTKSNIRNKILSKIGI